MAELCSFRRCWKLPRWPDGWLTTTGVPYPVEPPPLLTAEGRKQLFVRVNKKEENGSK